MNQKYKFLFNKKFNILYWILIAILICGIGVDIAFAVISITGDSPYITAYVVSAVLLTLLLILAILLRVCTFYRIGEKALTISFVCIRKQIEYDDILLIRNSNKQQLTLMYYRVYSKSGEEGIQCQAISIDRRLIPDFITKIKTFNPQTVYEEFDNDIEVEK